MWTKVESEGSSKDTRPFLSTERGPSEKLGD